MYAIPRKRLARYPRPLQGKSRVMQRSPVQKLANSYQSALDKANAANEQRYKEILAGYDQLHGRVMGNVNQMGVQERADIDQRARDMGANVYQNLVNRGFGNSSLQATMQMGVNRERASQVGRLNDRLAEARAR
jgi:hypothetical protein